jgi:ketosteroid isomerase-like protein
VQDAVSAARAVAKEAIAAIRSIASSSKGPIISGRELDFVGVEFIPAPSLTRLAACWRLPGASFKDISLCSSYSPRLSAQQLTAKGVPPTPGIVEIEREHPMLTRNLFAAILCLIPACAVAQPDTGPAPDVAAIHRLIEQYTKAVDTVDLKLLSQIWSHSPEVSFIYPLGEEQGYDAIEQDVFQNVMGGMFSARDLETHGVTIHVNGDAAWSEFRWVFHAKMRKDKSAVTTHGVETQIYHKESGSWRLVHVHYSEDHQAAP